jgi:outer membrane protein TolC
MADFIALAETRYAVSQTSQQDVFKAQLERSKMLDMQLSLEQQRKSLEAAMNSLVYRQMDAPVVTNNSVEMRPVTMSPEELIKKAEETRPYTKALQAMIDKSKAEHRLAEKEFYPDVTLSFEYMQRDRITSGMQDPGYDMYAAGLTFNLPVQRERRHAMLAESSSSVVMGTQELNVFNNSLRLGITDLLAKLEAKRKLAELYSTGIIPQAESTLESAVISYRVGKIDFMALLDSRLTLFNYERDYHEAVAEHEMNRAQLEALVGAELP